MSKFSLRELPFALYRLLFRRIVNTLFHIDWYHHAPKLSFLGVGTLQNPMDMWVKQEILFDVKPEVVVECGTHRGGTALYYAHLLSAIAPESRIITIDVEDRVKEAGEHSLFRKYVTRLMGDSKSEAVVGQVEEATRGKRTLVILDSWHERDHVRREMELYGKFVTPGSYMIVEDTNVHGHPVGWSYGPGPFEAVEDFLRTHDEFVVDRARERMMFTYFPNGWLKRVK